MAASKTIALIGAGVTRLAASCSAQMHGAQTHIFEVHDLPGGLCTAWAPIRWFISPF